MVSDLVGKVVLFIIRLKGYVFGYCPRRVQLFFGYCLGSILFLIRYRYSVVNENLNTVFPNLLKERRQQIARDSYTQLGNLILEVFMVLGPLRRFVFKYVDIEGYENVEAAQKQGKGLIFLSSHVGNWEVMAAAGGALSKLDLMLVTKHLKPEWLHRAIEKGRLACGVSATYEPRTLRDILSHLKKNGIVGFVLDQYVGPPVGVRVPLLGVSVGTALVVAAIAKRTGAPVLPVENYRTPQGRWVVAVRPPVLWESHPSSHYELALNTSHYVAAIESSILDHPEQWLWVHRRFKGDLSPLRDGEWNEPRVRR